MPPTALRSFLEREQISLADLARGCGLHYRSVKRIVAGDRTPHPESWQAMSDWLSKQNLSLPEETVPAVMPPRRVPGQRKPRPSRARSVPATNPAPTPTPEEPAMPAAFRVYLSSSDRKWFKLNSDPFEDAATPNDIWMPDALLEIDEAMADAIRRRDILCLVGEPGTGKSSLLRRLDAQLANHPRVKQLRPASINRSKIDHNVLAISILRDLTGRETGGMSAEARGELLRVTWGDLAGSPVQPVLIIDEAHQLTASGLLALKHVWDSALSFKPLAVILVGQPALAGRLQNEFAVRELAIRSTVMSMPKITGAVVAEYLRWRCARVGADADKLFTEAAYSALAGNVAKREGGLLVVNNLAAAALKAARGLGDSTVDVVHVGRV